MRSVQSLMDMSGRLALITGGAGHLGRAMAEALSEVGADVVILDLEQERCDEVCADLRERFGTDPLGLAHDLEGGDVEAVVGAVEERGGRLDVLVHNAAFVGSSKLEGWAVPFESQRPEAWRRALEVNLTAPFFMTQALLEQLRRSESASIIHIGSIYGVLGPVMDFYEGTKMGNPGAYAASKGGLTQLTRWLATTLAPEIRVNTISLGGVERGQPEAFMDKYTARTPLARMGTEEDIKGAITYLASDLSAYVTGHNLALDGGWAAW